MDEFGLAILNVRGRWCRCGEYFTTFKTADGLVRVSLDVVGDVTIEILNCLLFKFPGF